MWHLCLNGVASENSSAQVFHPSVFSNKPYSGQLIATVQQMIEALKCHTAVRGCSLAACPPELDMCLTSNLLLVAWHHDVLDLVGPTLS